MDKTVLETNKTAIEDDSTVIEDNNYTILENNISQNTNISVNSHFKDYKIIKQLPTTGAEADVYLIEKNHIKYILKLYRHGIELEKDKIKKILEISKKYPEDIVQIFEINKDENLNRWYEIQEYAEYGTLQEIIKNKNDFAKKYIKEIIKEMTLLLQSIHKENVIHRDIKPQNILVRTLEPLDLILTDFGISSIIDEEMSKIMTSKSGTRIYFAPESFSGVIGYEVDFWALGMIILEIYLGDNIFKGLNEGMIAHEIFTKGVEVPEWLDDDIKLLLKGLLTRDPKKRWNEKQIFQWLEGKRDISVHYDYNVNINKLPYKFNNKNFYSLKELLIYMYNLEYYEIAKSHIMRGYITKWLEKQELFDEAVILEDLKNKYENIDIAFFSIYNYFVQPDKFIWKGKIITLENLVKYIEKNDQLWLNDIDLLIEAYEIFLQNHKKDENLYFSLSYIKYIPINDINYFLKIVLENKFAYTYIKHNIDSIKSKSMNMKQIYEFFDESLYKNNQLYKEITNIALYFEDINDINLYLELSEQFITLKEGWLKDKQIKRKIEKFIYNKKQELVKEWEEIQNTIKQNKIISHDKIDCFSKRFIYLNELDKNYQKQLKQKFNLSMLVFGIFIIEHLFKNLNINPIYELIIFGIILIISTIILIKSLKLNYSLFMKPAIKWRELCKNS